MRLSRDSSIYKRIEKLRVFEKREAILTEIHARAKYRMVGYEHSVKINNYVWEPLALNETSKKIFNSLDEDKQLYFLSILLLENDYTHDLFNIREKVFADFGYIQCNENTGTKIKALSNEDCKELLNDIWWNSSKKAVIEPALKIGSSNYGGVNTTEYYLELSTGMTKEEALDFAGRAIDKLYADREKYQTELSDINFEYSICDFEKEKIESTNFADILFIFDYIELYSKNGKLEKSIIDKVHDELLEYHDYEFKDLKQIGIYSHSHVRNWIAKIRGEIENINNS